MVHILFLRDFTAWFVCNILVLKLDTTESGLMFNFLMGKPQHRSSRKGISRS